MSATRTKHCSEPQAVLHLALELGEVTMLVRWQQGERDVWSVVCVPSVEDEDARQLHRESG